MLSKVYFSIFFLQNHRLCTWMYRLEVCLKKLTLSATIFSILGQNFMQALAIKTLGRYPISFTILDMRDARFLGELCLHFIKKRSKNFLHFLNFLTNFFSLKRKKSVIFRQLNCMGIYQSMLRSPVRISTVINQG